MPPAPNQRRLPLHEMHDEDFEEILADVSEKEPGIIRAELKRTSGVEQFGVDIEGFSDDQKPMLVISCKCYRSIQPAKLKGWSNDFLDHIGGHWKEKGVKRFVLAVSVELNDDRLNAQIAVESARFKALGIGYEVWGLKKLTDKLRPIPHAIAKFFHPGWLEAIGAATAMAARANLPNPSGSTANSTATAQAAQSLSGVAGAVRQRLGDAIANQLEDALQRLREGINKPLRALVDNLKADRLSWDMLSPDLKAKFLRAEGSLAVRNNDLALAKSCYGEADVYAPSSDRTPSVLVARLEVDADFALALVGNPTTSAEAGARAGLLLELERPAEAIAVLDAWPNTSPTDDAYEPERLRSIAQLWHDRHAALATISAVEHLAPRQFAVQWAAAVVRFNFALSDKVAPILSTFPNPMPAGLFRDTQDARDALDGAERIFDILSRAVDTSGQAADLQVWRLACLILNPARFTEASRFATVLLSGNNPHPGAVVWATSAGLSFDQEGVVRALNARLKSGGGDASHAVAVAHLTFTRGAKSRAISALRRHRKLFTGEADVKLVDYWIELLTGKGSDGQTQKFNDALGKIKSDGNASSLLAMLDTGALVADMQLAAFETLALNGKWLEVNERRASLLSFGTSHAAEIALRAAFALNLHQDVVALANDQAIWFHDSRLPTALRVLVAKSRLLLGDASLALRALEEMRADDNSNELAFEVALMRLQIGDVTGAAATIRGRQPPADSSATALLRIAAELKYEDPELARRLLEGISFERLNHRLLPDALALVNQLGVQAAARAIMPRLFGPDAEPSGIVVINTVEEAIQFARENADRLQKADANLTEKWLKAEIPLHLVFDGRPAELASFFHKPFAAPPRLDDDGKVEGKPFLLRSGTRGAKAEVPRDQLVLDITALLLGNELGLLEHLEHAWARILLPNETPEILRSMESELGGRFGQVSDEARDVRKRLEDGLFAPAPTYASLRRLVVEPDDDPASSDVPLASLIAQLVARGMDCVLGDKALGELSLGPVEPASHLTDPLEFAVSPGDLVTLQRVGLLDRLMQDVALAVDQQSKTRWLAGFDEHVQGRKLADKITELRQLVARKADAGTWQFLPVDHRDRQDLKNCGAGAHLFLSLIRAAEDEPCDIWAEDRKLSLVGKIGNATIIDVANVLDRLSRSIGEPERVHLTKRLRRAGYGYTLPNVDTVVDALLAAPMDGPGLVESDELAAIRRDFTVQFANSCHLIDKAGGTTPGEPELFFLSRLLGLAGKVFAALWSRPNVGEARLNATAHWTSRHLRVEQAKFLPRENRTIEGREELLFLQYLSVLTAMFDVRGNSFRQARERRTRLIQWVIGAIVEPGLEIRPKFRARLVDFLAEALTSLGKLDSSHPDVTEQMLVGVILDYVNSFPHDWRLDLQRHKLLSGLVGLREVETIGFSKNFRFEAEQFYVAIAEAYATGKSTVPMLSGNRKAVITIIPDAIPAPDRPTAILVKSGKKSASVADDRLELESGDVEQRLRALKRHPSWFDLGGSEFDVITRQIAENPDAKTRRELLGCARAKAMTCRLRRLQEQISKNRSSDKELLLPPHPDSIRQFLRLSSTIDVSAEGWLNQSFIQLRDEIGPFGALARVGSIPFELGTSINGAIVSAVDEIGFEKALDLAGPTPMVRTALFATLFKAGRQNLDISSLAKPWEVYGVLHIALLRLAFRSAARRQEWQQVPEPERSVLLWVHANAVLEILENQGAAPKETAQIIDGFLKQRVDDVFHRSQSFGGRLLDPFGGTWREIAGAAIAHAIRDIGGRLNNAQRDGLRSILARQVGSSWLPHPELWLPGGGSEPKNCWLDVDPAVLAAAAGVVELPSPFNERSPQALALLLMQKIADAEVGEDARGYWPLLWMLGVNDIDAEARAGLRSLIGRPDSLPDFKTEDGTAWGAALRYRAQLFGKDSDFDSFCQMLRAAATEAQNNHPGERVSELSLKTPVVSTFHRLTEAIWEFSSVSSDTLDGCMGRFAKLAVVLADAWPSSLLACLTLLEAIAAQLETEPAGWLWDAINLLRSR